MDELLRKAAEHYPLKINEGEWEKVTPPPTSITWKHALRKRNVIVKYTSLFLIFLSLLFADGIINRSLKKSGPSQFPDPLAEKKSAVSTSRQNELSERSRENKEQIQPTLQAPFSVTMAKNKVIVIKNKSLLHKNDELITGTNNQPSKSSFYKTAGGNRIFYAYTHISFISNRELVEHYSLSKSKKLSVLKEQPPTEAILRRGKLFQPKGLYAGVVAGPLFDEVKNQGLKKAGFSAGFVAGYKLNHRWSVESGVLFAKKPYFSVGKYFSMDKVGGSMPQGMEILSLEGKNVLLEIPLRVKYDFLQQSNHHFFSTAGLSSFINTNEKNNYLVAMNGVQQSMISSYKNRSRTAAATLDFSAGYEFKIGKSDHVRIEPYLQIPLKGMGVGSMPMKSSGIRLGITKFFN
ncbi:outer membrane beta-barrel protein [Terrimonas alba]|uniref:outer membrane beta-barrel protein n=1 Tax=Terrimonas alba TaxID=3349636 RepID=UPI0035F2E45D